MSKVFIFIFLFLSTILYAKPLEKVSLQFHWLDQSQFIGYYMAKEKGFYEDAGLDVEFKKYKYGMNVTKEVTSGKATYAIGKSDLIVDISKGAKISMIASIFQSSPLVLLTTPKSGITSIKDFKNKKIMLTPDALNSVTYNAMLNKENLSFSNMQVLKHSFDINDLISGKVDLFQSYITNEPFLLKQDGIKPIIFDPKDYGFDFYGDILFTSENEIKNHRNRVKAFKEASLKGWKYSFENIDESVDIILKKYNTQKKSRDALIYEVIETKKLAYYDNNPLGEISTRKIERMNDAKNILNLIKSPVDIKKYIFNNQNKELFLTKEEINFLNTHQTLVVSNEIDYPPYDFFENNTPKGYSIDLMKLLASKLNINIKFETDNWDRLVQKFCDGKIDILHPTDKSEKVVECAIFTKPIIQDTSQFLLRNDFKKVNSLEDLYGYTIASPKGWQQTEEFKTNYSDKLKVIEVSNTLEAIKKVRSGEADFAFDYGNVLRYLKSKYNFNGLKVEGVFAKGTALDNLYIATNKNNKILNDIIQKTYDSLSIKDKENLQNRWLISNIDNRSKILFSREEIEYLNKKKVINACIDPKWMPFDALDKNFKHIGINSSFFKIFEKNLNIKLNIVKTDTWNKSIELAKSRDCDILSLAVETPSRKEFLNFTDSYLEVPMVIATKNNVSFVSNVEEIKDEKLAMTKGYAFIELLRNKYNSLEIVEVDNIDEGLSLVSQGKVFGYIDSIASIAYKLQQTYESDLKISGKFDEIWELGVGVRNDDMVLFNIFQKLINNLTEKQKQTILSEWISIKMEKGTDYDLLWRVGWVTFIICFFLLYRLKILRDNKKRLESMIEIEIEKSRKKDNLIFQQNKMASLGNMIATIAHQWRQPLSQLSMSQNLILRKLEMNNLDIKDLEKFLRDDQRTIQFMSQTINTFQNFYKEDFQEEEFKLIDSYNDVKYILSEPLALNKIELIEHIDEEIRIENSKNFISQIFLSILQNSIYFLSERKIQNPKVFVKIQKLNNTIKISISNNDKGIDEKIIDKIFDYSFSRRSKKGNSTGLGLYIVKIIVEEKLKGKIKAHNTREGVEFDIIFPSN